MSAHAWVTAGGMVISMAIAGGCGQPPPAGRDATVVGPMAVDTRGLVGHAWISDEATAPEGRLRLFLEDGTLLLGSCREAYRLVSWERTADDRLAWTDGATRVEVESADVGDDVLRLRLLLQSGETIEETYRRASAPYVCPELSQQAGSLDAGLGDALASCQ
jgi:hypothetical protein